MKKTTALLLLAGILLLNACKKTRRTEEPIKNPDVIPAADIDAFIKQQIQANNKFEWSAASDEMIWSALQERDNILSVGYKPADETNVEDRLADIDISSSKWKAAKQQVLEIILQAEGRTREGLSSSKMEEWEEKVLPVMDIRVDNFETVKLLRASGLSAMQSRWGTNQKPTALAKGPRAAAAAAAM